MEANHANDHDNVDPIDEEAAEIDPRSPEADEQIEELIEEAESEGRDVGDHPGDIDDADEIT